MSLILLGILNSQAAAAGGAGAYDLLETQVLSSSAASVTFTGLDSYTDYKHLQVRYTARSDDGNTLYFRANGDSGSNYSRHHLGTSGSSVSSGSGTSQTYVRAMFPLANTSNSTSIFGAGVMDILDFSNSSKNTTVRALSGTWQASGFNSGFYLNSGAWLNTNAVTSIQFIPSAGNLVAGSRFSLFGIKGA